MAVAFGGWVMRPRFAVLGVALAGTSFAWAQAALDPPIACSALAADLQPACARVNAGDATVDAADALRVLRAAAEAGDIAGQVALAERYARGDGVAASYAEAARWYARAAERD